MRHLIFQIAAPLLSFGNASARKERGTDSHPSRSFALGLLGAALGKRRDDPWHALASQGLLFSTVVLRPGTPLSDYHTVATTSAKTAYATRRLEAEESDYTIETWRDYLSDGYFLVGLSERAQFDFDLQRCAKALACPVFELFAGRKSCPLSLPPAPMMVDTDTLLEAYLGYRDQLYAPLVEKAGGFAMYWEPGLVSGVETVSEQRRKDSPVSVAKRLYRERSELEGVFVLPAVGKTEDKEIACS